MGQSDEENIEADITPCHQAANVDYEGPAKGR
jgi:hypothetical protein